MTKKFVANRDILTKYQLCCSFIDNSIYIPNILQNIRRGGKISQIIQIVVFLNFTICSTVKRLQIALTQNEIEAFDYLI